MKKKIYIWGAGHYIRQVMEEINDIQNLEIASEGKQYIVVRLGTEFYGIDIKYVDNTIQELVKLKKEIVKKIKL